MKLTHDAALLELLLGDAWEEAPPAGGASAHGTGSAEVMSPIEDGDAGTMLGTSGGDGLDGSLEDDVVLAGDGEDWIAGRDGDDFLSGGKDDDVAAGGAGDDWLLGDSGNDALAGGSGSDILMGGSGDDWLYGGDGDDLLDGGSGDDILIASAGNDNYRGGSGYDTLDLSRVEGYLDVNLGLHWISVAATGGDDQGVAAYVSGIELVIGNDTGGRYTGDRLDQAFAGGDGADWFRGMEGTDTFTGGAGADVVVWLKKDLYGGHVDRITDFAIGEDRLDLTDFAKGRDGYDDVVRIGATSDGTAVVEGLVKGAWVAIAVLEGHSAGSITVADLGLLAT